MAEILVGTSGYSYDDWRGAFYPLQLKRGDMLEYYAREFRYTEVNSTYYALPSQPAIARLAERTPPEFVFTVKAFRSMTHERQDSVAVDAGKFRFSLAPLIETGKLGAVLLQFPYSFRCARRTAVTLPGCVNCWGTCRRVPARRLGERGGVGILEGSWHGLRYSGRATTAEAGGNTSRLTNVTTTFIRNPNWKNGSLAFIALPRKPRLILDS